MDINPFEYVRPLPPGQVPGRSELAGLLVKAVRARRLVALAGPRRFGKTSLLGEVVALVGEVDAVDSVVVDCFGVSSTGEFAVRLERAMADLHGPARRLAQRLVSSSELGLSLTAGLGFKATFGRKDAPDPTAVLHALLDALAAVADRRGVLVLVLDEFQDIGAIAHLDAILRMHLQVARGIAVLVAGSRPSLLRTMFEDQARPFYAQAEIVEIGRLDRATATGVIADGFTVSGRDAGDAAEVLAVAVEGHPQRLMLTAHLLWEQIRPGEVATVEHAAVALEEARSRTVHEHRALADRLDRTHRDTLRAVVSFGSPYARMAERTLGLGRSSAQAAVKALMADALLERDGDTWRVVDPLFGQWLRSELASPGA